MAPVSGVPNSTYELKESPEIFFQRFGESLDLKKGNMRMKLTPKILFSLAIFPTRERRGRGGRGVILLDMVENFESKMTNLRLL